MFTEDLVPTANMVVLLLLPLLLGGACVDAQREENAVLPPAAPPAPPGSSGLHRLMKILENCGVEEQRGLVRVFLSNRSVTCNDGSPAGFYVRKSHGSKKWIIFLEGGWYCYDTWSCHHRWLRLRHLMTSKQWPDIRNVGGMLSPSPEENPHWWNANHVLVPYCSSDSWSGTRSSPGSDSKFSFMGSLIVQEVVRDLVPLGLQNDSHILLAGTSAGGTGVMLNLDDVQELVRGPLGLRRVSVRGVVDSGWFLDRPPYASRVLSASDAVHTGMALWRARVPPACAAHYKQEPWRCYFGYRLYPTIRAPLFVFQWLFDEAQMTADNVGAPVTKQQWDFIHKMGDSFRTSFKNVSAVFAPSCIAHTVLTKRDWTAVRIDKVSLPDALRCWEHHHTHPSSFAMLSDSPATGPVNSDDRHRRRRNRPRDQNKERGKHRRGSGTGSGSGGAGGAAAAGSAAGAVAGRSVRSALGRGHGVCSLRHVEMCSWPQCNHSCPKLHNPFTGAEMDFIELLKSFGLDMMSVANALGIDIHTLNNMDHEELLNLLTQQSS